MPKRNDLDTRMRAISDALDEYLCRDFGHLAVSWSHPEDFLEWLEKRGYTVVAKQHDKQGMNLVETLDFFAEHEAGIPDDHSQGISSLLSVSSTALRLLVEVAKSSRAYRNAIISYRNAEKDYIHLRINLNSYSFIEREFEKCKERFEKALTTALANADVAQLLGGDDE